MKIAAILFDLDGTLVDTIPLWREAITHMLAAGGVTITPEEFSRAYTPTGQLSLWLQRFNIDSARSEEMRRIRDAHYIDLLGKQVCWSSGAKELLDALKNRIPLGLVTGSWQTYVDTIDTRLSLTGYFKTIVTEDLMGGAGFPKPDPRGLLIAAEELGASASQCVYIGDMSTDVECANRAGMRSFIINGAFTAKEAVQQADRSFASLRELGAALRQEMTEASM